MPRLLVDSFGGVRPRHNRRLGPTSRASVALNVDLSSGTIRPIRQPKLVANAPECIGNFAIFGCAIVTDINPCASFATGVGKCHRLFATGLCGFSYPVTAEYDPGCSLDVVTPNWVRLGLVQPEAVSFSVPALTPPIAAPSITQGDQSKREHRDYVITYVNSFGEESAPSLGSADAQDADQNATATITIGARPDPIEGWDIQMIRIYRMMSGAEGSEYPIEEPLYLFVDEIDAEMLDWASPIIHVDNVPARRLEEPAPLDCTQAPPENLQGIIELSTGSLAGFTGKQLWFSQPFEYHNWNCWLDLDDCIKGIGETDGMIYVVTDGVPYTVTAAAPEGDCMCCREVHKHVEPAPLASDQRGITVVPGGVVYPSNDGLVKMSGATMSVLTYDDIDEQSWLALYPSTIKGAALNGKYYAFGRTAFSYDHTDGTFSEGGTGAHTRMINYSYNVDAVFTSRKGYMYIAMGDEIYQWGAGDDYEVYTWRSKLIQSHARWNWSAARLLFEDGGAMVSTSEAVYFTIFDGRDKPLHNVRVFNEQPFRLPPGLRERAFEIEIRGKSEVSAFSVATSIPELAVGSE